MVYTPEGRALMDVLWDETLQELKFAGVEEIIQGLRK
jgi:hypothetical protein